MSAGGLLRKNDVVELEITGFTAQGMGVGRYEGMAVFVPAAAPGDRLRVRILRPEKHFAWGKIEEILVPSSQRIPPDCPVFPRCGGCCYRHVSYETELAAKQARVKDALERIGGFSDLPLGEIVPAPRRNGGRNKALLPLQAGKDGGIQMGFYAVNSHRVTDCPAAGCLLHPAEFNRAMEIFRDWAEQCGLSVYDEKSHSGLLRRLYLRRGEAAGSLMVCVVVNGDSLPHEEELVRALREQFPGLSGVLLNIQKEKTNVALGREYRVLWGQERLPDRLCGLDVLLSPASFYQVNREQAQRLYALAGEFAGLTGEELLLDLYCGTGLIGLSMAGSCRRLIGVEIVPEAVEDARENARRNGIENAEFFVGDAAAAALQLARRRERPDVVLLDPPRKGCTPQLIETAAKDFAPQKIVYISCDPATLARDLRLFAGLGYPPQKAVPVDMFPGTAHVETVVLMTKEK